MFKIILVPTDGSDLSLKAADIAIELAKATQGRIVAVSVADPFPQSLPSDGSSVTIDVEGHERHARAVAESHASRVASIAASAGIPCETKVALAYSPYLEIVNTAQREGCDLICIASHGRSGISKLLLGSETQKVLAHTALPVLVVR